MARKSEQGGCLAFIVGIIILTIVFYVLLIVGLGILWSIIAIVHILILIYTIPWISKRSNPKIAMIWVALNILVMSILMGLFVSYFLKTKPEFLFDLNLVKPFLLGSLLGILSLLSILIFKKY